jgi:hypothetical protein
MLQSDGGIDQALDGMTAGILPSSQGMPRLFHHFVGFEKLLARQQAAKVFHGPCKVLIFPKHPIRLLEKNV